MRSDFHSSDFDRPLIPLTLGVFDLIAEIKERSPAEGSLVAPGENRAKRARLYAEAGAAAISVLTEPTRFGGSLSHLTEVVAALSSSPVPVMQKDFFVDPRQIQEARAAGASGVLLIVALQDDRQLDGMLDCAFEHSLFVLLESFDEADLARTARLLQVERYAGYAATGQLLIGINTRNLRTLAVEPGRLEALAPLLPEHAICVAESGLQDAADARAVAALGYRMALVGTSLMRAPDPAALVSRMLLAGRERLAG